MGSDVPSSKAKCKNKSKKKNGEIIARRKRSSDSIRKRQIILPNKLNEYQVELYGSNRIEIESEISEILPNSPKEMVKFYEKTDFKSERDNSNLPSTSSFSPSNKKIRIQKYIDKNGQYRSNVQHQQKSGAMNLYCTTKRIWKLSERNYLILKAVHIPGRINVTTDRLSRLEMSGDYHLNERMFQRIQKMWRCYPKVDLFASKKNRLTKIYASIIPRRDPDNIGNALRLNWSNIKRPVLLHPPIPLLLKILRKLENVFTEGKAIIKRELQLPPGNLNAYLLRNSSYTMGTKESSL
jgi:hypothetical protein